MPRKVQYYILTSTAERDFREARQWSLRRWGKELTKQYFLDLHKSAEEIAQNHLSSARNIHLTNKAGLSIHAVREHYIVYVPLSDKKIIIVALIRQTRDVPAILEKNSYIISRELKEISKARMEGHLDI
ncbi:type II toxin-antitoxin system RelE/ParE family toxin [Aliikangiella coralliicola]|uniref:Type II toxin-antitoxin system RelE/ParE family toxin n=1 Tax=Aliikangiella coralliicola TaxID=2592383 RepID=A0A545TZY5_9GAMM|nr:type II toxin-antitoxin system RelE/ParE family toxin [Aliikangiella coralliicola]TQV82777.1 type II toxin-antitoxin system RelE/ParE family toxin [Aliikangiella coralliicola]